MTTLLVQILVLTLQVFGEWRFVVKTSNVFVFDCVEDGLRCNKAADS